MNHDTFIHPEIREGEIFFTNTDLFGYEELAWQSKRRGIVAYDGKGGSLQQQKDWFPVFIQKHEIESSRMSLSEARREFNKGR